MLVAVEGSGHGVRAGREQREWRLTYQWAVHEIRQRLLQASRRIEPTAVDMP
jgi:hypothetical protein